MRKAAIELKRDCGAVTIPSGERVTLPKGTQVVISQALGGSFTVLSADGYLLRIDGADADALGEERAAGPARAAGDAPLEARVWNALRTVYDPEIPVDVVELGLVYGVDLRPAGAGASDVLVRMTLTAPGCGIGDVLKDQVELLLRSLPGVRRAEVEWVWDPPWDMSRMSEAAKLQVGMF